MVADIALAQELFTALNTYMPEMAQHSVQLARVSAQAGCQVATQ
jgi:hypothetical protein